MDVRRGLIEERNWEVGRAESVPGALRIRKKMVKAAEIRYGEVGIARRTKKDKIDAAG